MLFKLIKYELYDLLKSRWIVGIFIFYLLVSYILLEFGRELRKSLLSLGNVSLLTIPLFSLLLSALYAYHNRNFIEFVLTQPLKRSHLFVSFFLSLSFSVMLAYFISSFLVFYYFFGVNLSFIKFSILILSLIPLFVSIGMFCAFLVEDRLRGIGLSLLLWFAFCILYDTFLLYMAVAFSDYPIEKPLLLLTLLNPIDLLRLSFLVDAGLYEFIGSIGRPLLVYLKKWWFLPSLCSLFYTLIFYALGFRVFKGKDM